MTPVRPDRNLAIELVRVTEAAAMAAAPWMGRGAKEDGDQAAVDAMRSMLTTVDMKGVVVIGEGEKDEAPMLFNGEEVGSGNGTEIDIAVDPIDGTRLLAEGREGSLAVFAAAPRGAMFNPGSAVYMEKWVVGPDAKGVVDIDAPVQDNLRKIAAARGRKVEDLTVMMLDRDRHEGLKRDIRSVGARLQLIMDGDVAGSILAAWDARPTVDVLIGIGGTPEGVISACAVKALGGEILGRLWPRDAAERARLENEGFDLTQVLGTDDLVSGNDTFFSCTGITPGQLVGGVELDGQGAVTESLAMRSKSGTVRVIKARHRMDKLEELNG